MDCQRTRDLLPSHAAGALPARDAAAVAAHLTACPACRDTADAWHAVAGAMDRRAARLAIELPAYRPLPAETGRLTVVPASGTALHVPPADKRRAASLLAIAAAVAGLLFVAAAVRDPARVATVPAPGAAGSDVAGRPADAPTIVARRATPVRRLVAGGRSHGSTTAPGGSAEGTGRAAVVAVAAAPIGRTVHEVGSVEGTQGLEAMRRDGADPRDASDASVPAGPSAPPASSRPSATSGHESPAATAPSSASPQRTQVPTQHPTQHPTQQLTIAPPMPTVPASPTDAPPPLPTATALPAIAGIVSGIVYGGDGVPLAGARVVADRPDGGAGAGGAAEFVVVTDGAGGYALDVPVGPWIVHVEATGHGLMWRGGKPSPLDAAADAVDVTAGAGAAVDFHLEPAPSGRIRGRVVDAAGRGVARALVLASPPDRVNGGVGRPAAAAFTDADGGYTLSVPPGGWLVAATRDGRGASPSWWGGDGSLAMADAVAVDAAVGTEGIDVQLGE